jgi:phospholipase A-2-activating protein
MPPKKVLKMDEQNSFALREEILGHSSAVRSLCTSTTGDLVSGGADALANIWSVESHSAERTRQIADHEHNVTALTALPMGALDDCPTGGFVTGSMDKCIRIYNSEGTIVRQLLGHSLGVISLSFLPDPRYLISGSWDGTARVWDLKEECRCVSTLPDHENGVCVLGLSDGNIATGSTGRQENNKVVGFCVRIWQPVSLSEWDLVSKHTDHTGPVRSLSHAPQGFLSTSNDGTICLRSNNGESLCQISHPQSGTAEPFIYQGTALVSDGGVQEFVSCCEDCTAAVWSADESKMQVLDHPDSVWCGCALPNGDLATGCNDGVVRLWTRDPARMASPVARQTYAEVR